jgi:hypothetical protein
MGGITNQTQTWPTAEWSAWDSNCNAYVTLNAYGTASSTELYAFAQAEAQTSWPSIARNVKPRDRKLNVAVSPGSHFRVEVRIRAHAVHSMSAFRSSARFRLILHESFWRRIALPYI